MATFVVSPKGDNNNSGTVEAPFQTIKRGIEALTGGGDVLAIRGGNYAEDVLLSALSGEADAPIVIRPWGREEVTIDGVEPTGDDGARAGFRVAGNAEWTPAEHAEAHPDEYVSVRVFPADGEQDRVEFGAFVDLERYTRLITYSRLEDLRATNQTFGRLPVDQDPADCLPPCPGFTVVDAENQPIPVRIPDDGVVERFKRPWVYMGPGIFLPEGGGRIHIRLSHTANGIEGLADYAGGTDPRQVRLALSRHTEPPLRVQGCRFVRLEHLTVRFGGARTVLIQDSSDVLFDHVRVLAGNDGAFLRDHNERITFAHCEFRGGVPTWMFRGDIKDPYRFDTGTRVETNNLGARTSDVLLGARPESTNIDTVIHHCEFVDGHDLLLFGQGTRFHHNWIRNLNDDALIIGAATVTDLDVHHNVITQSLTTLSMVGGGDGPRRVHHNLIDLREPTAGVRPRPPGHLVDKDDLKHNGGVFRFGFLYKADAPDGALDLFHNTCLLRHRFGLAGFQHYVSPAPAGVRRSFNNIFVDVEPEPDRDAYATAFLPDPTFRGATDGNCIHQLGGVQQPLLQHRPHGAPAGRFYADLDKYRHGVPMDGLPSSHFEDSKALYPPGFENSSIDLDPGFRRIDPTGVAQFDDDLRLRSDSPALGQGVVLADPDVGIDDPFAPEGNPDIGCFGGPDPGLRVGVDGRRSFPASDAD